MTRYRKKPVVVEAMQFDGSAASATTIIDWMLSRNWSGRFHSNAHIPSLSQLAIDTLEGTMRADPGDWVIRGVKGEFYPCKPEIFDETYEVVEVHDSPPHEYEPMWCEACAAQAPEAGDIDQ